VTTGTRATRRRQAAVLANVSIGMTRRRAAAAADVPFSTLYEWLEAPEFRERVEKAEGEFERRMVGVILSAAFRTRSWRAALAILERRFPEWAARQRLEVTAEPRRDPFAEMSVDELRVERARLASIIEEAS
jgi:hypothetical protein